MGISTGSRETPNIVTTEHSYDLHVNELLQMYTAAALLFCAELAYNVQMATW